MGGHAARKALTVVEHVETILAIELLAACQVRMTLYHTRSRMTGAVLTLTRYLQGIEFHRPHKTTKALEAVHALLRQQVSKWEQDRIMYTDIQAAHKLVRTGQVVDAVRPFVDEELLRV